MTENSNNSNLKAIWSGVKLGMLLQFGGMGPICLLLFQLAAILPMKNVLPGIAAVTIADAIYILISLLGIVGIIKKVSKTSELFKKVNGMIIVYLGLSFALASFTDRLSYLDVYDWNSHSVFAGVLILTILNPVTIICYTGVFNAKLMDAKMSTKGLFLFGFGTLITTPLFMTVVVLLGSLGGKFLPDVLVNVMNLVVGALLIYWGLKYMFPGLQKKSGQQ